MFVPPHNALSKRGLSAVASAGLNILGSFLSFRPSMRPWDLPTAANWWRVRRYRTLTNRTRADRFVYPHVLRYRAPRRIRLSQPRAGHHASISSHAVSTKHAPSAATSASPLTTGKWMRRCTTYSCACSTTRRDSQTSGSSRPRSCSREPHGPRSHVLEVGAQVRLGIVYHMPFWQAVDGSLWEVEGSFARYVDSLAPYFDEVSLCVPVFATPQAGGTRLHAANVPSRAAAVLRRAAPLLPAPRGGDGQVVEMGPAARRIALPRADARRLSSVSRGAVVR